MPDDPTSIELQCGRAESLLELLTARDEVDYGEPDFTRWLLLSALRTQDFDVGRDAALAAAGDELLGGVALLSGGALGFVSPQGEGRGAGSRLLDWVERRAESEQRTCHRQRIGSGNEPARALLERAGYDHVRSVRHLTLALDEPLGTPSAPEGVQLSSLELPRDARDLHEADSRMFAANADYQPMPFEAFSDEHLCAPELAPAMSAVARRGERVVGFTVCRRIGNEVGFVDLLAVDAAERRRGLGRVLLLGSFRAFAAAGLSEVRLDVASDNPPAVALYASVGMTPARSTDVFEKAVRPG
jgi:ribosomal protein S18 acetylase RimI-like enzyme